MRVVKMYEYQNRFGGQLYEAVASILHDGQQHTLKCGHAKVPIRDLDAGEKILRQLFMNVREVPAFVSDEMLPYLQYYY